MILKENSYYKHCFLYNIWYFKCYKFNNDSQRISMGSYYINNGVYTAVDFGVSHFTIDNDIDTFEEVDFEIVKSFLPIGHPDIIEHRNKRITSLLSLL